MFLGRIGQILRNNLLRQKIPETNDILKATIAGAIVGATGYVVLEEQMRKLDISLKDSLNIGAVGTMVIAASPLKPKVTMLCIGAVSAALYSSRKEPGSQRD